MPIDRGRALITGATSGIGAAYAHALAEKGCDLILTGRRRDLLADVARRIETEYQVKTDVVIVELTERKELDLLAERVRKISPVDVLVNNAGFTSKGLFYEQVITEQEKMVLVHVVATMKLTHAVLPGMIERRRGAIINVASIQAVTPMSLSATYCSAKAFMRNFSISLHCEVRDFGVKVQCLLPGFTRTDLGRSIGVDMKEMKDKPLMRWMQPEEVVEVSLRELHKGNTVICVPGLGNKILYVLGRTLPERLWCAMARRIARNMP